MTETKLNYHGYELTFPNEAPAAISYIDQCDPLPLAGLIKSDVILSQGMKDFIADIVSGKLKREKHKRGNTERRDIDIHLFIRDLMDVGTTKENAIAQAAINFDMPEHADTIEAAYKRIKKRYFSGG